MLTDSGCVQSSREQPRTFRVSMVHGEPIHVARCLRKPEPEIRSLALGDVEMLLVRCGWMDVRRYARDLSGQTPGTSAFMLQLNGRTTLTQFGNRIDLEEGEFALCNTTADYELQHGNRSELILLRVPTDRLMQIIPGPTHLYGLKLAREMGLASTAAAMAVDIAAKGEQAMSDLSRHRAGQHLLEVLASAYAPLADRDMTASAATSNRLWKVKMFIDRHLRDHDLSPSVIASRMYLSDRYLRMIFSISDEPPSAYILRRRLEECARQLRDQDHSVNEIAFQWGLTAPRISRASSANFMAARRAPIDASNSVALNPSRIRHVPIFDRLRGWHGIRQPWRRRMVSPTGRAVPDLNENYQKLATVGETVGL